MSGLAGTGPFVIPFNVVQPRKGIVVLFEDGRVDELFAIRIGDGFGHAPAGFKQLGTLQDEHGAAQQDRWRGFGIDQDGAEGLEAETAQIVEFVAERQDGFGASLLEGWGKLQNGP